MRKFIVAIVAVGLSFQGKAQFQKVEIEAKDHLIKEKSGLQPKDAEAVFIGFRNPPSNDAQWQPVLSKVSNNDGDNEELLENIKAEKYKLRAGAVPVQKSGNKTTSTPKSPVVSTNFAGINNPANETPLDNTIAISDKDTIVAMANSQIQYFSITGTNLYGKDLWHFIADNSLTNDLCDPKVIWDNTARRFICYCQVCDGIAANSKIICGFSKTSNPMDGWYFYEFTGDALGVGDIWDYPKMAVSTDELFVTGNLFGANSGPFDQSVILQIQKTPCYSGATPLTKLWSGISGAFTIMPLGYGQSGSYGPGIYAVSFTGDDLLGGHIGLYDITNKIGGTPAAVLNTYDIVVPGYSPPSNAPQMGGSLPLNTGDQRVLDGFYLKKTAHFVHNLDAGSGYCGFDYFRLDIPSLTITANATLSNVGTSDYCYPAVASAVNDSADNSVVIAFNETSPTIYPRTCAVACDKTGTFSAPVVVQNGISYVSYSFSTTSERWGDYTGLCKRFGDPAASLWMAGMYGGAGPTHKWMQWIAKLAPKNVGVTNITTESSNAQVYPNPVTDRYNIRFNVGERQNVIINLTDIQGRIVVQLYDGIIEVGENNFSFEKGNLANGIYSLNIIGANTNIKNEKIVISGK